MLPALAGRCRAYDNTELPAHPVPAIQQAGHRLRLKPGNAAAS
jgi:hypothetical protein